MAGNGEQLPNRSRPSRSSRPTLTLPLPLQLPLRPSSLPEALFASATTPGEAGSFGLGFSPGPMTLVSSFFADHPSPGPDFKSFSQLLAGAMSSPRPPPSPDDKPSPGGGRIGKPANLSIAPPVFSLPPGLSPLGGLLDSPGLAGLFFPQEPYGMTHQQALAQVTAQASQAHSSMQIQAEYPSSLPSQPATSSKQFPSFASNLTSNQQIPPLEPEPDSKVLADSSNFPPADQRSQASSFAVDKPADDGYNWRKYGQKQVKGSEFPRSYYKCTNPNCPVKKKIERSLDGQITEIIYKGQHNHQPPQPNKRAKDAGGMGGNSHDQANFDLASQFQSGNASKLKDRKDQESSQATPENVSDMTDSDDAGDTETAMNENDEDEPDPKRRNTEVRVTEASSSHRTVTEPRIIVQTTSEVDLLDDGYRWRKYGQKVVKGNPYPRSYYKCTTPGCNVRKHVERAATDPRAVITTYEGKHNHDLPTSKNSSHNTANCSASQTKPNQTKNHSLVNKRDYGSNDQQPLARLLLKAEQIT